MVKKLTFFLIQITSKYQKQYVLNPFIFYIEGKNKYLSENSRKFQFLVLKTENFLECDYGRIGPWIWLCKQMFNSNSRRRC